MFHNFQYNFLIVVIITLWSQASCDQQRNPVRLNPNIRCPGKNVENIYRNCKHGGYIVNPDPKNCADRYECYVGINERCYESDRCADNAICTSCGVCQKCDNAESCSDFDLCPSIYGFTAMNYIKRLVQKRLLENRME